jgi:hypothetical protein
MTWQELQIIYGFIWKCVLIVDDNNVPVEPLQYLNKITNKNIPKV